MAGDITVVVSSKNKKVKGSKKATLKTKSQIIRAINKIYRNDKFKDDYILTVYGPMDYCPTPKDTTYKNKKVKEFQFTGNSKQKISFEDIEDNDYFLLIRSPETIETHKINWPNIKSESERIWYELGSNITIKDGQMVSSANDDIKISTNKKYITIKLFPKWAKSPNKGSRGEISPSLIVVHHTAGSSSLPPHFLKNKKPKTSAHYVIPKNGKTIKLVHESERANHAGVSYWNGNNSKVIKKNSIGIEIVHIDGKYTEEQYESLIILLKQLVKAHPTIKQSAIVGHSDIATFKKGSKYAGMLGRKHYDPGAEFEWERLEKEGLGIIPAPEDIVFPTKIPYRDEHIIYGIDHENKGTVNWKEVLLDLEKIGYKTKYAKKLKTARLKIFTVFNTHFRSINGLTYKLDHETAKMIKRVVYTINKQEKLQKSIEKILDWR